MGFRFRKSIKAGPIRINLSKSGVGYSVGTKGFRYTKKAGGGTRTTASIPGTGISYVKESSAKKERGAPVMNSNQTATTSSNPPSTRYCKYCYRMLDSDSDVCPACGKPQQGNISKSTSPKKLSGVHIAAITIMAFTFILAIGSCGNKDSTSTIPTEATIQTETVQPTEAVLSTEAETTPWFMRSEFSSNTNTASNKTYVLNTSTMKFHYSTCSNVDGMNPANKDTYTGSRSEVIAKGYEPCGRCNP